MWVAAVPLCWWKILSYPRGTITVSWGQVCCEETTPGLRAASQERSVNDCHSENGFSHFLQLWPHEPRQVRVWTKLWWLPICPPRLFTGQRTSWMGRCNWGRPWVYCFGCYIQRPSLIPLAHGTIPCSEPPSLLEEIFLRIGKKTALGSKPVGPSSSQELGYNHV